MPEALPKVLLAESPATKFLYSYLLPQGAVDYSVRELAEHTGLAYKSVSDGLGRLKALELMQETKPAVGPARRVYSVKCP